MEEFTVNCVALDPTKSHLVILKAPVDSPLRQQDTIEKLGKAFSAAQIRALVIAVPEDTDIDVYEQDFNRLVQAVVSEIIKRTTFSVGAA